MGGITSAMIHPRYTRVEQSMRNIMRLSVQKDYVETHHGTV